MEKKDNMRYVPLRVYSVFSRGKGAVDARTFAGFLKDRKISSVAVSDPFSMLGWESFRNEAVKRDMKPLLGMEIKTQGLGSFVIFPLNSNGYISLISSFNSKLFSRMENVAVIFIPGNNLYQFH